MAFASECRTIVIAVLGFLGFHFTLQWLTWNRKGELITKTAMIKNAFVGQAGMACSKYSLPS